MINRLSTMRVKCINPKNYKLTRDNEYEVEKSYSDTIVVTNDKNCKAIYSKVLFDMGEKVEEVPAVKEEPKKDTIEDVIKSIVSVNKKQVEFTINKKIYRISWEDYLEFNGTNISCGISQLFGLNGLGEHIMEQDIIPYEYEDHGLQVAIYHKLLEVAISNRGGRFILASTNTNSEYYEVIKDAIEKLDIVNYATGINPNSDNEIRLWTINK